MWRVDSNLVFSPMGFHFSKGIAPAAVEGQKLGLGILSTPCQNGGFAVDETIWILADGSIDECGFT